MAIPEVQWGPGPLAPSRNCAGSGRKALKRGRHCAFAHAAGELLHWSCQGQTDLYEKWGMPPRIIQYPPVKHREIPNTWRCVADGFGWNVPLAQSIATTLWKSSVAMENSPFAGQYFKPTLIVFFNCHVLSELAGCCVQWKAPCISGIWAQFSESEDCIRTSCFLAAVLVSCCHCAISYIQLYWQLWREPTRRSRRLSSLQDWRAHELRQGASMQRRQWLKKKLLRHEPCLQRIGRHLRRSPP